jgi:L-arabinonolactonase
MTANSVLAAQIEVFARQEDLVGEGPIWSVDEQALYWLDIGRKKLFRKAAADTQSRSWALPDYPGCLAELHRGAIAVAVGEGIVRMHLQSGQVDMICASPPRSPRVRFNDGKVDPLGRLWVGTMQNNFDPAGAPIEVERFDGALYRFDSGGMVVTLEEGLGIPNTLAWSPDLAQFYFADSLRGEIYAYDFDAQPGELRNKRVFFAASAPGVPDGSAIDIDGCLWNARWDGGAVVRITPDGKLDRIVPLPVPRPTSCIFGGPALDTLYVTSARNGLDPSMLAESPLSGSVLAVSGLAQGLPVPAMTGVLT